MGQVMTKVILYSIALYQRTLSPDHGVFSGTSAMRCRFYPSCSQYTADAVKQYGPILGVCKGIMRIARCNPLSKGGVDYA